MRNLVTIISLKEIDEYQGFVHIDIHGYRVWAVYTFLKDIAHDIFQQGDLLDVDMWLLLGIVKQSKTESPCFSMRENTCCGFFRGRIISMDNYHSYRLDCGDVIIDVHNERDDNFQCGDWVEVEAELQIFPAHNDCTKEIFWGE